ncbi:M48 family metalloprotease [Campylobacter sp. JMF_11 EL3]|uniref:M48 family metalloprotease n=1 Tax=Campylobacter sp. JMF_11 EL3 TaxID=2983841 RepID=UPI0022EA0A4E|nr:M48 family metalloprotease [Campylobacter sp. JMF_11 EL3]MDA3063345.1 M48 family metalloprotease [Campylobacter sp. JMF_11 EL3]
MEALSALNLVLFYLPEKFCHFLSVNEISCTPKAGYYLCVLACSAVLFAITRIFLGKTASLSHSINEHQKLAKSKVAWLNFVFASVLVQVFWLSYALFFDFLNYKNFALGEGADYALPLLLSVLLVCVILFNYIKKRHFEATDISSLAKGLDATEIHPHTAKNSEKILLNIIEEMAIASRVGMPRVFIMKNENGVNAMASGENFGKDSEKIAIFVTAGAMRTFNRDEMQGVIAHEFSHAFHDDIELNIRLISVIGALGTLSFIGYEILRAFGRGRSGRNSKGSGIAIVILVGVIFWLLGLLGKVFAELIQSAISRQKEFLADASAAKYTRNPLGIKKALDKLFMIQKFNKAYHDGIGKKDFKAPKDEEKPNLNRYFSSKTRQKGSINTDEMRNFRANPLRNFANFHIKNTNARACAHMFFLPAFSGLFATHPSLQSRIKKLKEMGA